MEEAAAKGWKPALWIVPALVLAGALPALGAPVVGDALDPASCGLELRSAPLETRPALVPQPEQRLAPEGCAGIRPGARIDNVGCTFNFVYTNGTRLFIGTAGHCVGMGQRITVAGIGAFGTVVVDECCGSANDVALILVDADKESLVDPTLCTWGGPTGVHTGPATRGTPLFEYGWGIATQFHPVTRARAHVLNQATGGSAVWVGVGSGGDSGGPVVDETGEAFAIHTFGITPVAGVYNEGGPTVERILEIAAEHGLALSVVTGDDFRVPNGVLPS